MLWNISFSPLYLSFCLVNVYSATEIQFPAKPLRESQSRLLTSTPSWIESDSAEDRERNGKRSFPFLLVFIPSYKKRTVDLT